MAAEDKQRVREHMRKLLLERKRQLEALAPGDTVRARYNGEIWEATIVQVKTYKITLPEFRLRFGTDKTLYWTSSNQIVLPGDDE